jgi:glycosyltransferase involved in cell wall biosynthesis
MRSPAACTIISRNYLSYARILARSWQRHQPGARFYLLVVDRLPEGVDAGPGVLVVEPEELGLSSFPEMCRMYDVTELSTAMKPSLLALLLDDYGEEAVAYLDPDILILRPLPELWDALAGASLVLTPHLLRPIPRDGRRPGELDILLAGAYNLGFIAVRACAETRHFLAWWAERLRDDCRIDPARGLFVDQRWVDLVPGLFPSTVLWRDETCNVAYWNLHSRPLERRGDRFFVHGRPVGFFHFSGFDPATPWVLSRHQDRLEVGAGSALADLLAAYTEMQLADGFEECRAWGYGYARREDGIATVQAAPSARPENLAREDPGALKTTPAPLGVNLAGYFAAETGVGEAVRSEIRSFEAAGIAYVRNHVVDGGLAQENPHPVNLVHVNADQVPLFVRQKGAEYFRHRYNIGYWFWEISQFPEEWQGSFERFQEIWVGSRFTQDVLSRVSPVPVVHIPLSVEEDLPREDWGRSRFRLPPDRFVFLFVFDFKSYLERKNPLGLIRAFRQAFGKDDKVTLVHKCSHGESFPSGLAALQQAGGGANAASAADIRILDGVLSRQEINTLLSLSDCYVSLHRSEGFGLTLAEAMSLEKPVIATGYSGNMDFMTPVNSFPVDYRLIEIAEDHGPYKKGAFWADPDVDHAVSLMRLVYEDRERAREAGRRARQDIRRTLAPEVVGGRIRERLQRVTTAAFARRRGGAEEDRLLHHIRQVVGNTVEVGANVVVVSKGDDELLKLESRQGWHFPQVEDGRYAGHHPADSLGAVGHLEALRAQGGGYLLFPSTAFWWLEYYDGFTRHLDSRYPRIWQDESCILYRLAGI